jgi:uncharacterized protein (DUF1330 family)
MAALVIVDINITDPVRYEEYKRLAAPTVGAHGGKYLVRGGRCELLEGARQPGRIVVLEFPTVEHAKAWWGSESYRPAKEVRHVAARTEMLLVEGI